MPLYSVSDVVLIRPGKCYWIWSMSTYMFASSYTGSTGIFDKSPASTKCSFVLLPMYGLDVLVYWL